MLVSGPISYKKMVLDFVDDQPFHKIIHLFGDHHTIKNQCQGKSMLVEEVVEKTLRENKEPIDVFCEVGFPRAYDLTENNDYLDSFYDYFHTKFDCFSNPPSEQCKATQNPHRFHNIDLRHTLYIESYRIVTKLPFPIKSPNYTAYSENVTQIKNYMEDYIVSQPFTKKTRLLIWTHYLISIRALLIDKIYRKMLESHSREVTERTLKNKFILLSNISNAYFIEDLYYVMTKTQYPMPTLKAKIQQKFPDAPPLVPYYLELYHHTISTYPSKRLQDTIYALIEKSLKTFRDEFNQDEFISLPDEARETISSTKGILLMDLYTLARICKPYINHIIMYVGHLHIDSLVKLCEQMSGARLSVSPFFGSDKHVMKFDMVAVENVDPHDIPPYTKKEVVINHYNKSDMIRFFRKDCVLLGVLKPGIPMHDVSKDKLFFLSVENERSPDYTTIGENVYQCTVMVENKNSFPITIPKSAPIYFTRMDIDIRQCVFVPELRFDETIQLGPDHAVELNDASVLPKYKGRKSKRRIIKRKSKKY